MDCVLSRRDESTSVRGWICVGLGWLVAAFFALFLRIGLKACTEWKRASNKWVARWALILGARAIFRCVFSQEGNQLERAGSKAQSIHFRFRAQSIFTQETPWMLRESVLFEDLETKETFCERIAGGETNKLCKTISCPTPRKEAFLEWHSSRL